MGAPNPSKRNSLVLWWMSLNQIGETSLKISYSSRVKSPVQASIIITDPIFTGVIVYRAATDEQTSQCHKHHVGGPQVY